MNGYTLSVSELIMCEPLYKSAERFLKSLINRNRTEATIRTYSSILSTLIRSLVELKGSDVSLEDISEEDVYTLIRNNDLKETTMKQKLCVLGSWMEYETGRNPVKKIDLLWNKEEVSRRFITLEQFEIIYSSTQSDMERLILLLGAELGMRRHEIVDIELDDIKDGKITIHGKGHGASGKEVVKTLPDRTYSILIAYEEGERKISVCGNEKRLLIQDKRCKHPGESITDSTIDKMCQRLSKKTNIKFSPHDLRRLYCMTLAKDCGLRGDLDTLRRMMRHESIDTTLRCYLDVFPDRIEAAEDRLNKVMSGKKTRNDFDPNSNEHKRN